MSVYTDLLEAFSECIGIEPLVPDEKGYCSLATDDDVEITLHYDVDKDEVTLFSVIGMLVDIPNDKLVDFYQTLLNANLFWQGTDGGTVGIDSTSGLIIFAQKYALVTLDINDFHKAFESFIAAMAKWRLYITELPRQAKKNAQDRKIPIPHIGEIV